MRSPKVITAAIVYLVGVALAAANLWFTAARSTIPRALDGVATTKSIGREKHPGRDDVFWITLGSQPAIHVDEPIYRAIAIGQRLKKPRWSRELRLDDRTLTLTWSRDFGGMLPAMPIILVILAVTTAAAIWPRFDRPES